MNSENVVLRRQRLQAELGDAQSALVETLDKVGPGDWVRESSNEGWRVLELLTHITTAEVSFTSLLRKMASGGGGVPDDFSPDRWNAGQLRRRVAPDPSALRNEQTLAFQNIAALLEELDDKALDQHGRMSTGGIGSVEDTFHLLSAHKRQHTRDIATALL